MTMYTQMAGQVGQLIASSRTEDAAAYNAQYQVEVGRHNALSKRDALQANLAAVQQDKVLTNLNIKLNQAQAEANATVAAAAAGVQGQSVDAVVYETKKSEAQRVAENNRATEQQSEQLSAQAGSAH